MTKLLIVVDMQNDFITGSLGSPQAKRILPNVKAKIEEYNRLLAAFLISRSPGACRGCGVPTPCTVTA